VYCTPPEKRSVHSKSQQLRSSALPNSAELPPTWRTNNILTQRFKYYLNNHSDASWKEKGDKDKSKNVKTQEFIRRNIAFFYLVLIRIS